MNERIGVTMLTGVIVIALLGLEGCNRNSGPEPTSGNLAPVGQNTVPEAPPTNQARQPEGNYEYQAVNENELAVAPQPPPLPVYSQPECPGEDYIWTPGYWDYSPAGYYWVPGVWVLAPYIDALWTPPYWEFYAGRYRFHHGYWGRYVGFYGGINYGFGYTGLGFYGGYWNQGVFFYNRAVTDVNLRIVHNVYRHSVDNYTPFNRMSYNGGTGGIARQPVPAELAMRHESRIAPLPVQMEHARSAAGDRAQFAGNNRGRPATMALARPLATPYRAPAAAPRNWAASEARPREAAPNARPEGSLNGRQPEAARAGRQAPQAPGRPMMAEPRPGSQGMRGMAPQRPEQRPAQQAQRHVEARPQPQHAQASPFQGRSAQQPHVAMRPQPQHAQASPFQGRPAAQPHVAAHAAPAPRAEPPRQESRPAGNQAKGDHGRGH